MHARCQAGASGNKRKLTKIIKTATWSNNNTIIYIISVFANYHRTDNNKAKQKKDNNRNSKADVIQIINNGVR